MCGRGWLNAITHAGGQFVAVGGGVQEVEGGLVAGIILTSPDGVNWARRQSGAIDWFSSLVYGNGLFVAAGLYESVLSPRDGVKWTVSQWWLPTSASLRMSGITFGNGQFVAVGHLETNVNRLNTLSRPIITTSPDGVGWAPQEFVRQPYTGLRGVAYGNGRFVAVGDTLSADLFEGPPGIVFTSTDGTNWVQQQSAPEDGLSSVVYANGLFVALSTAAGALLTSVDGVNWVQHQTGTPNWLSSVAFGNGHFVAVGEAGTILESGTIITLSLTPNASSGLLNFSLSGPVGVGCTIQSSTDLVSWRNVTNIVTTQPTSIIFDALSTSPAQVFYRAYSQ